MGGRLNNRLQVEAAGSGVVVAVGLQLHARVSEDGGVVSPGGLGQVHVTRLRVEAGLETQRQETVGSKHTFVTQTNDFLFALVGPYQKVYSNTQRGSP